MVDFYREYFKAINTKVNDIDFVALDKCCGLIREVAMDNKKIIIVGNGGSASVASHVSVDFTKIANIRAINFNEADLITCFANDYGYENWVAKGLEFYADGGDLVILISSSGKSRNIINGAIKARDLSLKTITLSGFSPENPLRKLGDINLWVDSSVYNIIEITHSVWLLTVLDKLVEDKKHSKFRVISKGESNAEGISDWDNGLRRIPPC